LKLNPYQKFQLCLAGLAVFLFLDLWACLQFHCALEPELKAFWPVLWGIVLLLMDPKDLAQIITSFAHLPEETPPPDQLPTVPDLATVINQAIADVATAQTK
jgi:hypothetical protein